MKFLFLFEDGSTSQGDLVGPEDYESVRNGYLDVIRYSCGKFEALNAHNDTWHEIDVAR